MLATRIRQKDGIFYFVSFKARDILNRVRFTSRFYFEGETIEADAGEDDPIAKFIGKVERSEKAFQRLGQYESIGDLEDPKSGFLIIDGQHRLAGLQFFGAKNPGLLDQIEVPCVIFDGKTGDFAAEMFVIINSTQTRINRSHLIDLLDRISASDDETRLAAQIVKKLYEEDSSPLQYKINRLGGRSKQEKWILQAELFNEIKKLVIQNQKFFMKDLRGKP